MLSVCCHSVAAAHWLVLGEHCLGVSGIKAGHLSTQRSYGTFQSQRRMFIADVTNTRTSVLTMHKQLHQPACNDCELRIKRLMSGPRQQLLRALGQPCHLSTSREGTGCSLLTASVPRGLTNMLSAPCCHSHTTGDICAEEAASRGCWGWQAACISRGAAGGGVCPAHGEGIGAVRTNQGAPLPRKGENRQDHEHSTHVQAQSLKGGRQA